MISKARKQASVDSTYGYVEALEYNMGLTDIGASGYNSNISDGEDIDIEDLPKLKLKGKEPEEGTVTILQRKVTTARLCINGYWVDYEKNTAKIDKPCNPGVKLIEKIDPASTSSTLDSITVPINAVSGTTVTATAVDEEGNEITGTVTNGVVTFSGLKAGKNYKYEIKATDSSGNETVRKGTVTTVSFNHIDIKQDTNEWAKKKTITITTEENLNGTGTELQYKIGSGNWTKYTQAFEISENTTIYARLKNGENTSDEETLTITKIDNVTIGTPTATVTSGGYPIITISGIKSSNSNILKIAYTAQEGTSPYYSLDNGNTWTKYTGEVSVNTTSVKAKLKRDASGLEGDVVDSTIDSSGVTNALPEGLYNGDETDQVNVPRSSKYYATVDSNMIGKKIKLICPGTYNTWIITYDSSNEQIDSYQQNSCNKEFIIPSGSVKLEVYNPTSTPNLWSELAIVDNPIFEYADFDPTNLYPIITSSQIISSTTEVLVSIEYSPSSVQKLYKIDDGDWQTYTTPVSLGTIQTIYAKGINSDGNDTHISSSVIPDNNELITGNAAFDGDDDSGYYAGSKVTKILMIDSSVWNKKIRIKASGYHCYTIFDKDNQSLKASGCNRTQIQTMDIPTNSYKLSLYFNEGAYIYDISITD